MSAVPRSTASPPLATDVAKRDDSATAACSYSIGRRLSWQVALLTMLVVGFFFACAWSSIRMLLMEKHAEELEFRGGIIAQLVSAAAAKGGEAEVVRKIESIAAMRGGTRLELRRTDGTVVYADPDREPHKMSRHLRTTQLRNRDADAAGGALNAAFSIDFQEDAKMGASWAGVLVVVTLAAGALVALGSWWRVRSQLRPLFELAQQTRSISPRRLDQRLRLGDPAEELLPWIDQFNALMERLERAYTQLEGFNADVAHELRTPLATLIGQTEVALSRERSVESLRETLVSNLEELQRLSVMVNDMLFLSLADRGATARRGAPVSLAALARASGRVPRGADRGSRARRAHRWRCAHRRR